IREVRLTKLLGAFTAHTRNPAATTSAPIAAQTLHGAMSHNSATATTRCPGVLTRRDAFRTHHRASLSADIRRRLTPLPGRPDPCSCGSRPDARWPPRLSYG